MSYYIFLTAVCVAMAYFVNSEYRRQLNSFESAASLKHSANGTEKGGHNKTTIPCRQEIINRAMLVGIFLVLFGLSAFRVGIGNDYWVYRNEFLDIHRADTPISFEIGFQSFVRFMQLIVGVDNYIPIFAVLAFVTCLFFVKGIYDTSDWFMLSFLLFMANGFYFMSFSNVRYYLVLSLVIYSMKYFLQKRYVPFILIILFAAFFHMTVILVIPAFFVAYYLKWSKKTIWLIPAAALILIFARFPIRKLLFVFYPYYEGDAILDVNKISYVNVAKCLAILVLCLLYYKKIVKGNAKAEMLFNMNLFALLLYSCASYIPEISRVCYYLVIGQIFLIPLVIGGIDNKKQRTFWTAAVVIAYLAYFIMFLKEGSNPVIQILPYFSWYFS